jgi:aryl-alcohol dehydrogenase-like predicted oxidoreductase
VKYVEENVGAVEIHFTAAELERIDAALPPGAAAGMRYPEPGMRTVNR